MFNVCHYHSLWKCLVQIKSLSLSLSNIQRIWRAFSRFIEWFHINAMFSQDPAFWVQVPLQCCCPRGAKAYFISIKEWPRYLTRRHYKWVMMNSTSYSWHNCFILELNALTSQPFLGSSTDTTAVKLGRRSSNNLCIFDQRVFTLTPELISHSPTCKIIFSYGSSFIALSFSLSWCVWTPLKVFTLTWLLRRSVLIPLNPKRR